MRCRTRETERLQVLCSSSFGRCGLRHVDQGLCRLSVWYCGNDMVRRCIDGGHGIAVLDADVDARAISGGPDAMGQVTHRNGRHLVEIVSPKGLHLVQSADG